MAVASGLKIEDPPCVNGTFRFALFCGAALLRVLVGFQPHSGQDNWHGSHAAYGGDFEAQRHWMELTLHLPVGDWYWYDLTYWGLDYPPLTAYISYLCGYVSSLLVGPESVAFETSRGIEDPTQKAYMRATVLVLDLALYITAAWLLTRPMVGRGHCLQSVWSFVFAVANPAIILIDHGHFQYNTTALGFSLWAFFYASRTGASMVPCVVSSVFFCMALSFKQMTLYYALGVFSYLLGRCYADGWKSLLQRVTKLGITVVLSFSLIWWPVLVFGPSDRQTTFLERCSHVFRRIIPVQRGLFEGKVANLWCALSVKPVRIRDRIPHHLQFLVAMGLTLLLTLPALYVLFRVGRWQYQVVNDSQQHQRVVLWGATTCALAFFLASFQVHEKSLLLALAPASMLFGQDETFVFWFSVVTAWSLWPLLVLDRLQVAYFCTILIFAALAVLRSSVEVTPKRAGFFEQHWIMRWLPSLSYCIMMALHLAELVVAIPPHLPDLFPVLWSIVGCAFCCVAWLGSCWHLHDSLHFHTNTYAKVKAS